MNPADHSKKTNYNITYETKVTKFKLSEYKYHILYTNEKETKYKAKETRYKMVIYKMMIHKMKNLKKTTKKISKL